MILLLLDPDLAGCCEEVETFLGRAWVWTFLWRAWDVPMLGRGSVDMFMACAWVLTFMERAWEFRGRYCKLSSIGMGWIVRDIGY